MGRAADRLYEQSLVARCQVGDDEAFAELVGRYHPRVAYFVRRLLGSEDHLEDVLQETWLAALRMLPRLRSPGAFPVWLYRIARNQACRHLRRRQRRVDLNGEPQVPPAAEPDEPEFTPDQAAAIHGCLERLSHPHREVLVLRFLEGMTYEEIAQVVACPAGTVRSRIHYAKRTLRREMEEMA